MEDKLYLENIEEYVYDLEKIVSDKIVVKYCLE